jgi:hypothetical protein
LVTSNRSDLELVGIPNFVERLQVACHGEVLGVLDCALATNVGTVGNIGVRAAIVLAVNTECIEFVLLDKVVDVDLLLVGLRDDRKGRLHIIQFN